MDTTEVQIRDAAQNVLKENINDVQILSKGAYSQVYKAKYEKSGIEVIAKVYFKTGFMNHEIRQLEELRKYSIVPIPEIYGSFSGDGDLTSDIFFMESMPGIPVRYADFQSELDREKITNAVVDAHIAVHDVINHNGFGDLDCGMASQSWEKIFRSRINDYYGYLTGVKDTPISGNARMLIDEAYYSFDSVFTQPVKEARLIHGDFKMKNVLIDPETFKLTAILDPMGCCYGDRESDLFPYINHPRDVRFGFMENYASKVHLSDNFPLKNMYYFLWNEVKLFVFMGYCMNDVYEKLGQNIHDMLRYGW